MKPYFSTMAQGDISIEAAERALGVSFADKDFLYSALTHRSYLNEHGSWPHEHNERLEYLGDAVLELIVSEALYKRFPSWPEGKLTLLRAALVNYQILARVAQEMRLHEFVLMSRGESRDEGKAREVILANAMEAVVGAVYLDRGFEAARKLSERFVLAHTDEVLEGGAYKDAKSELQELVQEKLKLTPTYKTLDESGPAHKRIFRMGAYFKDELVAEGSGGSKQEAEIEAAKNALKKMK